MVTPRADPGFERRPGGRLGLDWVGRRHLCFREWSGLRRGLELQHVAQPSGVLAVGGMPQAEVAHLVEAARQHVLKEAADVASG